MTTASISSPDTDFDVTRRFVRIIEERQGDMVEFEFAIGEPAIFVELIMPRKQFDEFCREQGVTPTYGPLADEDKSEIERQLDHRLAEVVARFTGRTESDAT